MRKQFKIGIGSKLRGSENELKATLPGGGGALYFNRGLIDKAAAKLSHVVELDEEVAAGLAADGFEVEAVKPKKPAATSKRKSSTKKKE